MRVIRYAVNMASPQGEGLLDMVKHQVGATIVGWGVVYFRHIEAVKVYATVANGRYTPFPKYSPPSEYKGL